MTLSRPLVVFSAVSTCGGPRKHEHRLITDGLNAYAYSPAGDEAPAVHLDADETMSIACTQVGCHGRVEWPADETTADWTSDGDSIALLTRYGKIVEHPTPAPVSYDVTAAAAAYLHSNDPGAATVWNALTGLHGAAAILHAEYVRDHPTTTHTAPF